MRPQQPYRALRSGIGALIIVFVVGLWGHGQLTGQPMGTLWHIVMLAIVIAAGIAVFGRRTFTTALDEAEQVKGDDDDG
ncbi:hypothetical protein ACODNH_05310 [Haloarcula sp. NS06]|uniref:hypothetical protein n=1 Tax=Haloarcula sp. NS06 TaxID=3409688 RepID=UPI003DA79959